MNLFLVIVLVILGIFIVAYFFTAIHAKTQPKAEPIPKPEEGPNRMVITTKSPEAMVREILEKLDKEPESQETIEVNIVSFDLEEEALLDGLWRFPERPEGVRGFVRQSYVKVMEQLKNIQESKYSPESHARDLVTNFLHSTPCSMAAPAAVEEYPLMSESLPLRLNNPQTTSEQWRDQTKLEMIHSMMGEPVHSLLPSPVDRSFNRRLGFFPGYIQVTQAQINYRVRQIIFKVFFDDDIYFPHPVGEVWMDYTFHRPLEVARVQQDVLAALMPFSEAGLHQEMYRSGGFFNVELRHDNRIILISDRSAFLQCGLPFDDVRSDTLVNHLLTVVQLREDEPNGFVQLMFGNYVVRWFYSTQTSLVKHQPFELVEST